MKTLLALSIGLATSFGEAAPPPDDQWQEPVAGEEWAGFPGRRSCTNIPMAALTPSTRLRGEKWMVPSVVAVISKDTCLQVIEAAREQLKTEPMYLKLSYAPYLLDALKSDARCATTAYEAELGCHDLTCVAGRAAWLLDDAFEINIPTVTASMPESGRLNVHDVAKLQMNALFRGIERAVAAYRVGESKASLMRRYQESLQKGSPPAHGARLALEAKPAMDGMLDDWFPLGKKLADLEDIVGRRARALDPRLRERENTDHVTGVFKYWCTNGMFGHYYFFLVRDGVIEAVSLQW